MAPAQRKSTGKAAPAKGAASAVSPSDPADTASAEETVVVEQTPTDPDVTVDAANPPNEAERELLREAAAGDIAAQHAAKQLGIPADEGIPAAARLPLDTLPKVTEGVEGEVGAVEQPSAEDMGLRSTAPDPPVRDLAALRALAETSGYDPVTPYPADDIAAPNPLDLLPEPRSVQNWTRETDEGVTGRVLVDGWRVSVNGSYNFAQRGDRITAPVDIMRRAESQGVVIIEE